MEYGWSKLGREEDLIIALLTENYEKAHELLAETSSINFRQLLMLTTKHRINTLIMQRLIKECSTLLPVDFYKTAKLLILQHITADKLRRKELIKISTLLKEKGYEVTLMKGFSYDPEGNTLRNFNDIDILIDEEKIKEIITLLQECGYTYQGSFILSREEKQDIEGQFSWNNQYQFKCPDSRQIVEVHTNLFERDRVRLENLKTLLGHNELYKRDKIWNDGLQCYIPCPEASLMLLCLHCSLKRSLGSNEFILRHMSDMDVLFKQDINGKRFISLCRESKTVYHGAFSLKLYEAIMLKESKGLLSLLEQELSREERYLLKRHLHCLKNLKQSGYFNRKRYNFLAPFIIGGSRKQRITWIRNNIMNTKVQQENRYHQLGFKVESPFIYLTYFINPFQTSWRFLKKVFNLKPINRSSGAINHK